MAEFDLVVTIAPVDVVGDVVLSSTTKLELDTFTMRYTSVDEYVELVVSEEVSVVVPLELLPELELLLDTVTPVALSVHFCVVPPLSAHMMHEAPAFTVAPFTSSM